MKISLLALGVLAIFLAFWLFGGIATTIVFIVGCFLILLGLATPKRTPIREAPTQIVENVKDIKDNITDY